MDHLTIRFERNMALPVGTVQSARGVTVEVDHPDDAEIFLAMIPFGSPVAIFNERSRIDRFAGLWQMWRQDPGLTAVIVFDGERQLVSLERMTHVVVHPKE